MLLLLFFFFLGGIHLFCCISFQLITGDKQNIATVTSNVAPLLHFFFLLSEIFITLQL